MDLAVHLRTQVAHIQEVDQEAEADQDQEVEVDQDQEVDQVLHLVTYLAILLWDQHLALVQVDQEAEVDLEVEVEVDQQVDHQAHQVFQSTVSLIKVKDLRKYLCALTV